MKKLIHFSKMHGLGNDFMILDCITQDIFFEKNIIIKLANRHLGVGFDQMLLVESSDNPEIDFHYRIFNSDGNEVSQCGNGARCLALFVRYKGLTNKKNINVSTKNSCMLISVIKNNFVSVNMGEPNFDPKSIPFISDKIYDLYSLHINKEVIMFGLVSIGNPHCIIKVDNIQNSNIEFLGPILESHKSFANKINVSFMEVINYDYVKLRVYERGVGETLACGSGACAAVAFGIKLGIIGSNVSVELPGGIIQVTWNGVNHPLFMIGSAVHVYDGLIYV